MSIVILANRDLASNFALNLLVPHLSQHNVSLFLSAKVGGSDLKPVEIQTLSFFEQTLLTQLLSPLLEKLNNHHGFKSFGQISKEFVQPVSELNEINSPLGLAKIRKLQPDVILSIRYGRILKEAVLALPPLGVLNLHSGLLPDYRGVMASFWAMLNGEKQLGTSLHYIDDASIDTGRIIAQSYMPVRPHQSYLWHVLQLYIGGCELVTQALQTLALGEQLKTTEQQQGRYYSFPNEQAIKRFEEQGLSLVKEDELVALIHQYYF